MTRIVTLVQRHGPLGLPAAAARRAQGLARARLEEARELTFDRRRRIVTRGVTFLDTFGTTTRYQPVHPLAFRDFLCFLPADRERLTFVDYGSGRGRALFLAIEHGFGAAVGVELEPSHHAVAAANLRRYRGRASTIRLIQSDARDFELPAGPLAIFLYNPFPREVMVEVLAAIGASLRAAPRPAWIIYEAPIDRDLLDADPRFELLGERVERAGASPRRPRFAIYRATLTGA